MSHDYEVGYAKPPKKGQFKKGQSGNPKGRPKGTKNLKTDLLEELGEKLIIMEGGKDKKVSKQRAMIKSMTAKAIKGDVKAATSVLSLLLKFAPQDTDTLVEPELSVTDKKILADFEKKVLEQNAKSGVKHDQ